jgi:3-phosphoshikimate 1-carboxyvinyltransferase
MDQRIERAILKGVVKISPSKSDSQRAILAAALSKGTSNLYNVGNSADENSMLNAIQQLGAKIKKVDDNTLEVTGSKHFPEKATINSGESGLGARLLTAVCAAHKGTFNLIGEGTILHRPMMFFDNVFPTLGVSIKTNEGYLPFKVEGPMYATEIIVDGSQSSQYVSGLLMALPLQKADSVLKVENLKSTPYLSMTISTLAAFGIEINYSNFEEFRINGNQEYKSTNYTIEGDWSSASYWLVTSALGAEIFVNGLSMKSLQADKRILDALIAAGCSVIHTKEGISIDGKERHAFVFDATNCPDLFPSLVAFAALTNGISKIKGVHRLKHKESDRGEILCQEFKKLGVEIELNGDIMLVHGNAQISGGTVDSCHDHRIAMCFAIIGNFANKTITIKHAEAVSKSYPDFWEHLKLLRSNDN